MEIKNSLDWQAAKTELMVSVDKLPYDPSIRQMIRNIDAMVTELSKLEVVERRTKISHYVEAERKRINDAVENVEKIIMIAVLYS